MKLKFLHFKVSLLFIALILSSSSLFAGIEISIQPNTRLTTLGPPVAVSDVATTPEHAPIILNVLANDLIVAAPIDPQLVKLIDPVSGMPTLSVTVADQGTYVVNTSDGTITFSPVNGFLGSATPVKYTIQDVDGNVSNEAPITVTAIALPPIGVPDVATTPAGTPVTMNVSQNDISVSALIDPWMVKLIDPVTGSLTMTVTVANEGTYYVDYRNGNVIFTPVAGFAGVATPVYYTGQDFNGTFSIPTTITVTVLSTPLPVTLSLFTLSKEGHTIKLNWETTAETNSDHFEIQHSVTGKDWNKIGSVDSHGESTVKNVYTFNDLNPASGGPSHGENLYRLKMIDRDATFAYSRIQSIKFDGQNGTAVSIYPNPSTDKVFIQNTDISQVKQVSIMDMNGHAIFSSNSVSADGINVSKFISGTYILYITNINGSVSNHKIVIVR